MIKFRAENSLLTYLKCKYFMEYNVNRLRSTILLLVFSLVFISGSNGQKIHDVNLFSGTASVEIPIDAILIGNLKASVSLIYNATGIKVSSQDDKYGLGWTLSGRGVVTRLLKGFPDDLVYSRGSITSYGWMRTSTIRTNVGSLVLNNDGNNSTCNDEVGDINNINNVFSSFGSLSDTEPDMFAVSAPGLSTTLVFDNNGSIRTIPYDDLVVTYTTDGAGTINSFIITNDQGVKYTFSFRENIDKYSTGTASDVIALKREFDLYQKYNNVPISFTQKWYLTRMEDQIGNAIIFDFENSPAPITSSEIQYLHYRNPSTGIFERKAMYTINTSYAEARLKSLRTNNFSLLATKKMSFSYNSAGRLTSAITSEGNVFGLFYELCVSASSDSKYFLRKAGIISTCASSGLYQFAYAGVFWGTGGGAGSNPVPSSTSNKRDIWDFNNGSAATSLKPKIYVYPTDPAVQRFRSNSIPSYVGTQITLSGEDRLPNITYVADGTLTRVIHPYGGMTEFQYEAKDYYDPVANSTFLGGGIRIKKIYQNDGMNNFSSQEFIYTDPITGVTSGKAITVPSFTLAIGTSSGSTTQDKVEYSTYRSEKSLSAESDDVIYGKVTVKRTGAGKTIFEFNTSATWGSPAVADWASTANFVARLNATYTTCPSLNPAWVKNEINSFPFPGNPNFDFERGRIIKETNYNETGGIVSEVSYTYQRANISSVYIWGLKYEDIGTIRHYSKFKYIANNDNLTASKITKVYDINDVSKYVSSTDNYYYQSIYHKKLTKMTSFNSDWKMLTTNVKYTKDFPIASQYGDASSSAINRMIFNNINIPVETFTTVIGTDELERVTEGTLIKYGSLYSNALQKDMYLPTQVLKFTNNPGVVDFQISSSNGATFTNDSRYAPINTMNSYNDRGFIVSSQGTSKVFKTTLYDLDAAVPVASFGNAKADEVAYSSFDFGPKNRAFDLPYPVNGGAQPNDAYSLIASENYVQGRAGSRALLLKAYLPLSTTVNVGKSKYYIMSFWIKSASANNALIKILNGSSSTDYSYSISSANDFKYYEFKIPVPSGATIITSKLQLTSDASVDDVIFYPSTAEVSTNNYSYAYTGNFAYQLDPIKRTAQTNTNGVANYTYYDEIGRPVIVKDQDFNIVQKISYKSYNITSSTALGIPTANVVGTTPYFKNNSINFFASGNDCYEGGVTYTWNFGDGTSNVVTTINSVSHVYATTGSFNVTVNISNGTQNYTSTSLPLTIYNTVTTGVCQSGVYQHNVNTNQTLTQSCTGLLNDNTHSYFKLIDVNGDPSMVLDAVSISWEKTDIIPGQDELWTQVGTTATLTLGFNSATPPQYSYKVRCRVQYIPNSWTTTKELYVAILR